MRVKAPAAFIDVSHLLEFGRDLAQAHAHSGLGARPPQPLRQSDQLGVAYRPRVLAGRDATSPILFTIVGLLGCKAMQSPRAPAAASGGHAMGTVALPAVNGATHQAAYPESPAAAAVLSSGLGKLIRDFEAAGCGQVARSWVSTGANQPIAADELEHAVGNGTLDALSCQTGLGKQELVHGLREQLPEFVDQLTPEGRLPSEHELSWMV
jgi:uncharacterized protein YidB (DUF937 family)